MFSKSILFKTYIYYGYYGYTVKILNIYIYIYSLFSHKTNNFNSGSRT